MCIRDRIKDVMSKSALVAHIAGATEVAAKDVRAVMASLEAAIHASIGKKGACLLYTSRCV